MKKLYFYAMVIACLFCTASIHAQDRFWILASGTTGDWDNTANWSTTSGGGGGASVPNGAGFHAIFNQGATVNVDVAAITLSRLTVSGVTPARLIASTGSVITVQSGALGTEGLRVEANATLESRAGANVPFSLTFANGARGVVNGTWDFTGDGSVVLPNGATFNLPAATGQGNRLEVNGQMIFRNNTRTPLPGAGPGSEYLFFQTGSTFQLDRNGGGTPQANWDANSTILVTGVTTQFPNINLGSTPEIGHFTWNTPAMAPPAGSLEIALNGITVQGNLSVLNTNGQPLTLMSGVTPTVAMTVEGNVNVSGTSIVYIGEDNDKSYEMNVVGAFNLSGGSFLMQAANTVGTNSTVLSLQGNFNHTGGTFGLTSTDQSATNELFVVELDGTAAQTITSTGTVSDPNSMITLRLNNAAGASLASPASFGKISWNSANKGILTTTTANVLSVTNPDATAATVINAPANNGYVSGPIRRSTNSTSTYLFPTGKSGFLRSAQIIPAATTASVYTAEYFRATPPSSGSVMTPLDGVTNLEYWNVSRQSGSSAGIQLTWSTAITGADVSDGIVVAGFTGASWVSVKGTNGTVVTPGNIAAGTVRSEDLPSFNGLFTLAFGPAGALPIDLVSFTGKKLSGNAALLNWSVTSSSTPDRFEVLRSADGGNFSTVGTVQGVDQQINYSYTDNSMPTGTVYYRLRMIDINGEVKLSKVIVLTNGTDGLFLTSMWPTVVTNGRAQVNVSSSQRGNLQLVVTDMYGRIVKQQISSVEAGSQQIWLNLHALPGGAYHITGYMDGKRSSSIRFVKQ
jgi:hypothetical protein